MASSTVSITTPRVAVPMRSTRAMARATVAMARAGRGSSSGRRANTLNRRREDERRRSEERASAPPLESMRDDLALLASLELGAPTAASDNSPEDGSPGVYREAAVRREGEFRCVDRSGRHLGDDAGGSRGRGDDSRGRDGRGDPVLAG